MSVDSRPCSTCTRCQDTRAACVHRPRLTSSIHLNWASSSLVMSSLRALDSLSMLIAARLSLQPWARPQSAAQALPGRQCHCTRRPRVLA